VSLPTKLSLPNSDAQGRRGPLERILEAGATVGATENLHGLNGLIRRSCAKCAVVAAERRPHVLSFRTLSIASGLAGILALTGVIVWACSGTPQPPDCWQTAYLAKSTPSSVVAPPGGGAITVPITVIPFVDWNAADIRCAQPTFAEITLTLTCTPVGGGAPITIGPMTFADATPTVPGFQPSPIPGVTIMFPIAAGTLAPGTSYTCPITGTYAVSFTGGVGTGTITGTGDAEVCIVESLADSPGVPRLNMQRIDLVEDGLVRCRRGDQSTNFFLITNNDPSESVSLDFSSTTDQVARFPMGDDPDGVFYAISSPVEGTDNFQQSLDLPDGELITLGDPEEVNDQQVMTSLELGPNELTFVGVKVRSNGKCADGSCSEMRARAVGSFSDDSPVEGCAGIVVAVDDVDAKSPLCEVTDMLQTAPTVDTAWSPAVFDGSPITSTHSAGNLRPNQSEEGRTTQTTGADIEIPGVVLPPPVSNSYYRTETPPGTVNYSMATFAQPNFSRQVNNVNVINLPESGSLRVPHMGPGAENGQSEFDVNIDLAGMTTVSDAMNGGELLFEGSFDELIENPPAGIVIDNGTFREISCSGIPDDPMLGASPTSLVRLYAGPTDPSALEHTISVFDPRDDTPLAWMAVSNTPGVEVVSASGSAGTDIVVRIDPDQIALAPETTLASISITSEGALNNPVIVPVAFRKTADFQVMEGGAEGEGEGEGEDGGGTAQPGTAGCGAAGGSGCAPGMLVMLLLTTLGLSAMKRRKK
jgi:hypothetical protein